MKKHIWLLNCQSANSFKKSSFSSLILCPSLDVFGAHNMLFRSESLVSLFKVLLLALFFSQTSIVIICRSSLSGDPSLENDRKVLFSMEEKYFSRLSCSDGRALDIEAWMVLSDRLTPGLMVTYGMREICLLPELLYAWFLIIKFYLCAY